MRSIRQSTTCAGLTLVPSVSDQRCGDLLEQIDRLAVLTPAPVDQAGGVLEELGPVHRRPPFLSAQSSSASASASLSSAGSKPSARTAAITASLSALPLPVTCRLMVPTGTPRYGILLALGPGGQVGEEAAVGVRGR